MSRRVLRPGGRFAFETRNPGARAWEDWHGMAASATDAEGREVTVDHTVDAVDGDLVTFTEVHDADHFTAPVTSTSTLRFLGVDELVGQLLDHGFVVTGLAGDWDGLAPTPTSPELVVLAERAEEVPS